MGFFDDLEKLSDYNKMKAEKLLQNKTVIKAMNKDKRIEGAFVSSYQSNYLFCPGLCKTCKNLDIHINETATPIWCRAQIRDSASELSKENGCKQYDQCIGYSKCTEEATINETKDNNNSATSYQKSSTDYPDSFSISMKAFDTKLPEYVIANNLNDIFTKLSLNMYFIEADSEVIREKFKLFLRKPEYKNNIIWSDKWFNNQFIKYVDYKKISPEALQRLQDILNYEFKELKSKVTAKRILYLIFYYLFFCIGVSCAYVGIVDDEPILLSGLIINGLLVLISLLKFKRNSKIKKRISNENREAFEKLINL